MVTAATAPEVPATTKLEALQANSSRQTLHAERPVDSAIAVAMSPVLTMKYVAIAMTSGPVVLTSNGPKLPPRTRYTPPVAAIVSASAAVLKTVRYSG